MSKYGAAKAINYEKVWYAAMNIEYLATNEIKRPRADGEELLLRLKNESGCVLRSITYERLEQYGSVPVLATVFPYNSSVSSDILRLLPSDDAASRQFLQHKVLDTHGPEVLEQYALRMQRIENGLRNAAIPHYVEFIPPHTFSFPES